MDFRAAARHLASALSDSSLSGDFSMDPTGRDPSDPTQTVPQGREVVHTDGGDPASPGGSSPYNGSEPFGQPVVDDEMWRDPSQEDTNRGGPIPHVDGPDEDKTTLHNARHLSYVGKAERYGSR